MSARGTRAVILDAAVELGSLRGLEELTLGGLASTVEMSKSGLFAHFGSKQELQLATVAQAWDTFEKQVLLDSPGEPQGDLHALLERWLSFYERRVFKGGCFFVVSAVEFGGHDGEVRGALNAAVDRQVAALEVAVAAADQRDGRGASRDAGQVAFELHSMLVNADALFHVRQDPAVFERARVAIAAVLQPT